MRSAYNKVFRAVVDGRLTLVHRPRPAVRAASWPPEPARAALDPLEMELDRLGGALSAHGTITECHALEVMASVLRASNPGTASALVDWSGAEVARLRAFGAAHGMLLARLDDDGRADLVAAMVGSVEHVLAC